jgi:hypothetical protein
MIDDLMAWVHREIEDAKAQEMAEGQHSERRLPVSVWAGFADVGRGRGREVLGLLAEAGVSRVIFTPTNDAASTRWKWQPSRAQIVRGILAAKELSLEVWLGPWVRCSKPFLDEVGQQLRELADEVGGVDGWELDAEGSWEVTARSAGNRHPGGIAGAVEENLHYLTQHMLEREMLGAPLSHSAHARPGDVGSYPPLLQSTGRGRALETASSNLSDHPSIQRMVPRDLPKS